MFINHCDFNILAPTDCLYVDQMTQTPKIRFSSTAPLPIPKPQHGSIGFGVES